MDGLTFTPKGLDPHLTYCPRCKGDAEEITIGIVYRYKATSDGEFLGLGHAGGPLARHLIDEGVEYKAEPVGPYERLPASGPCPDCEADLLHQRREFEAEVIRGGLHWYCVACDKFGVIVADDSLGFCRNTRSMAGVFAPEQIGVRFLRCSQHRAADDIVSEAIN